MGKRSTDGEPRALRQLTAADEEAIQAALDDMFDGRDEVIPDDAEPEWDEETLEEFWFEVFLYGMERVVQVWTDAGLPLPPEARQEPPNESTD